MALHSCRTRRSSYLGRGGAGVKGGARRAVRPADRDRDPAAGSLLPGRGLSSELSPGTRGDVSLLQVELRPLATARSEEHTSELQSRENLVCSLLLEK